MKIQWRQKGARVGKLYQRMRAVAAVHGITLDTKAMKDQDGAIYWSPVPEAIWGEQRSIYCKCGVMVRATQRSIYCECGVTVRATTGAVASLVMIARGLAQLEAIRGR